MLRSDPFPQPFHSIAASSMALSTLARAARIAPEKVCVMLPGDAIAACHVRA
jgi:hypothetical protein